MKLESDGSRIHEEIEHHLDELTHQLERRGLTPEEARAEALRRFGDPVQHARRTRTAGAPPPGTAWIASSSLPGDSVSWVESLVLRVRVYSDSVLPQASVKRVQFNHPRNYPVSSTGRRIQDRVNQECRIVRSIDRIPSARAVDLPH